MNGRFSVIPGKDDRKFRLLSNQADFKQIVSYTDFYSEFLCCLLWPPCVADADIIFALWFLLLSSIFFLAYSLSRHRVDVYHTSTHGVALVRI